MIETPRELIESVTERVRGTVKAESHGPYHQLAFRAMSTPVRMCFEQEHLSLAMDLQRTIVEWISCFEARYSRFIPQSIVGQINASAGGDWSDVDAETEALLHLCDEMHALTGGVFDAATLPIIRLWDWKVKQPLLPDSNRLAAALEICGWDKVDRRPHGIRLPSPNMGI